MIVDHSHPAGDIIAKKHVLVVNSLSSNKKYGPVCGCGGPGWTSIVNLDMIIAS